MALTKVTGDFIKDGSITQGHLHSSHGITTSDIGEGSNLYFTTARVDSRIGDLSTSDLSEGTNLYYTDARADARITLQVGSNLDLSSKSTSNLSEGTNLYYTQARFNTAFTAKSTSDLSEGTNLYYTDARADARITAADTDSLSEGSTNLYYTDARADARVALIVDSAPGTLNTLNELAAALGDDANFSTTVTNSIALKAPLASPTFTGSSHFTGNVEVGDGTDISMDSSSNGQLMIDGNGYQGAIALDDQAMHIYHNSSSRSLVLGTNETARLTIAGGGNATFTGTITASGYNDSNWNTAYTYSQVGHLPLAGGTLTGQVIFPSAATTKPVLPNGFISRNDLDDTSGRHDIWGISERYYPSNSTAGDAWGIQWAGTPNDIVFVGGGTDRFTVSLDEGNITAAGTITATGGNSTQWNTAYGWGDHSAAGYAASATTLAGYGITNAIQKGADIASGASWTTATKFNSTGDLSQAAGNHALSVKSDNNNDAFMSFHISSDYAVHFGLDGATNRMHVGGWSEGTGTQYQLYDSRDFSVASVLNSNVTLATLGYTGATNANYITNNNQLTNGAGYLTNSNDRFYLTDTRGASRAPSYYDDRYIQGDFSQSSYFGVSGGDAWAGILTVSKWSSWDASHRQEQLIFAGTKLARRVATSDTAWSSTYDIIDTSGVDNVKSGYIQSNASLRAPIFYDSNDTNYYINPNSTSYVKYLGRREHQSGHFVGSYNNIGGNSAKSNPIYTIGSSYNPNETTLADMYGIGYAHPNLWGGGKTSDWGLYVANNGGIDATIGDGAVTAWFASQVHAAGDFRAPIFYDLNNTGYYVNPEGDSNFGGDLAFTSGAIGSIADGSSTVNQVSRIVFPQGGAGSWDGGQTGAIKIRLPIRANNNMWTMKVRIYNYATSTSQEYLLGNYSYSNGGYNSQASFHGGESSSPQNVRFGNDGTYDCVWIGETTSTWSYPVVSVLDFQAGFRGASIANNIDNYDISIVTSFGTVQTTIAPNTKAGNIVYADSSFRAPIFYDSGNTGYYMNPDSESKIVKLWINNGGGSGVGWSTGLNMGDGSNYWNMIQDVGVARQRNFGAGGYDWFSNGGTQLMDLSNTGNLLVSGDMRAPVFYDSNNTAYYTNPNSQSSLWGVAIRGDFDADGTENQIFFYGAGGSTTSAIGFKNGGQFANPTGNGDGWNTMLTMDTDGRGWVFRRGTGGTNFTSAYTSGWILNNGVWQANASMRAPIFYDSGNTGYYADPAGLSVMHSIKLIKHVNNTPRWDFSAYVVEAQHFYGNSGSQTMYLGESNYINIRNTADIHGDARAPIYYDRNNTAYYTRPSTSSNINSLYTAGLIQAGSSGTGNIYIGGTSGNYFRFHTNNSHTYFDANVGDIHWRQGASTRFIFYMTSANMTINGSLTQNSDERVKENIVEIPNAIDKVKAMKGVYYNRTDFNTDVTKVGVLAQEVEAVLPELIVEAPDSGLKSVAYGELTAVLINAVKEQQTIIDDLKSRLETLENN